MTGSGTTPETAGVLTHITALRVEVQVERLVAERINWAKRSRDRNPSPALSFTGTLGDFDPDPKTGRGKTVQALRRAPEDPALTEQLRGILDEGLRGNFIQVTATAPAMLRLRLWTIQEAGRSHQAMLAEIECLQPVRLLLDPSREAMAVVWRAAEARMDSIAEPIGIIMATQGAVDSFLRALHRQKPRGWFADMADRHPGGLPVLRDEGTGPNSKGEAS